jgi:hypothetical protein
MLETNWIILGLCANLGFEYRTLKSGYFYFGASTHLPLTEMAEVIVSSNKPQTNYFERLVWPAPKVIGTYITLDIRYFFNPGMKPIPK